MNLFSQERLDKIPTEELRMAVGLLKPETVGTRIFLGDALSSFEKGSVNKALDIATGLEQSVIDLGVLTGQSPEDVQETLKKKALERYGRFNDQDKFLGAAGEFVLETAVVAPLATLGWFGKGGKLAQIYKQGTFGFIWDYLTTPETEDKTRLQQATQTGLLTAGAQAIFGTAGRFLEKITNFDFKDNIQRVKDAAESFGIKPGLLGDFTGDNAKRAAEAVSDLRGGGANKKLKQNIKELEKSIGTITEPMTSRKKYTGIQGQQIANSIQNSLKKNQLRANRLYKVVDVIANKGKLNEIPTDNTKIAVNDILKEYPDLFPLLERPQLVSKLEKMASNLNEKVTIQSKGLIQDELGNPLTPQIIKDKEFSFKEIRATREALSQALQAAKQSNKFGSIETNKIRSVIESLDKDLDTWAESNLNNKQLYNAYSKARDYYKGNVIPFRDADLAITLLKDPASGELKEDVAKLVSKLVSPDTQGQEGAQRAVRQIAPLLPDNVKQNVASKIFEDAREQAITDDIFDPQKFISYIKNREKNFSPFFTNYAVDMKTILNKYNALANSLTRKENTIMGSGDETITQATKATIQTQLPTTVAAPVGSLSFSRIMEAVTRSAFNTKVGREIMLSAKSIDDYRPLITGAVQSLNDPKEEKEIYKGLEIEIPEDIISDTGRPKTFEIEIE